MVDGIIHVPGTIQHLPAANLTIQSQTDDQMIIWAKLNHESDAVPYLNYR